MHKGTLVYPVDLFILPGWTVQAVNTEQGGARYCITATVDVEATSCSWCGAATTPYHYGYREKLLLDLPFHMKPVRLRFAGDIAAGYVTEPFLMNFPALTIAMQLPRGW